MTDLLRSASLAAVSWPSLWLWRPRRLANRVRIQHPLSRSRAHGDAKARIFYASPLGGQRAFNGTDTPKRCGKLAASSAPFTHRVTLDLLRGLSFTTPPPHPAGTAWSRPLPRPPTKERGRGGDMTRGDGLVGCSGWRILLRGGSGQPDGVNVPSVSSA